MLFFSISPWDVSTGPQVEYVILRPAPKTYGSGTTGAAAAAKPLGRLLESNNSARCGTMEISWEKDGTGGARLLWTCLVPGVTGSIRIYYTILYLWNLLKCSFNIFPDPYRCQYRCHMVPFVPPFLMHPPRPGARPPRPPRPQRRSSWSCGIAWGARGSRGTSVSRPCAPRQRIWMGGKNRQKK